MLLRLVLGMLVLVGCTAGPGPQPAVDGWDADLAAHSLDRLSTAALDGDRAAFDAELASVDPGSGATADRLFANLHQLGWVRWSVGPERREPTAGRRAVLGAEAVVVATEVRWSTTAPRDGAAGDGPPDTQRHRVWTTWVVQDGAVRLAGTVDGPAEPDGPTPLWWWEPTTVVRAGDGLTLLVGADPQEWQRRSVRAWQAARGADVDAAHPGRTVSRALVEVPSTTLVRDRVLGSRTRGPTAALTVADPEGLHPVVVDPGANLADEAWELVLTHELVHVLSGSPGSGSPRWLVEGLAESVAREAYPAVAPVGPAQARAALSGTAGLPPDEDLVAGSAEAYLRAWVAVRLLQDRLGRAPVLQLVARTADGGDAEEGLREQGWSGAGLARAVDDALAELAAGRPVPALR